MNGWVVLATAILLGSCSDLLASCQTCFLQLSTYPRLHSQAFPPVAGIPGFVPGLIPERVPFSFPSMGFSLLQLISFWILCLRSTNFRVF